MGAGAILFRGHKLTKERGTLIIETNSERFQKTAQNSKKSDKGDAWENRKRKQKKRGNPLWTLVFLAALAVFLAFPGTSWIGIYLDYKTGTDEYRDLQQYTTEITKTPETPALTKTEEPQAESEPAELPNRSRNHCRIRQNRRLPSILNP